MWFFQYRGCDHKKIFCYFFYFFCIISVYFYEKSLVLFTIFKICDGKIFRHSSVTHSVTM